MNMSIPPRCYPCGTTVTKTSQDGGHIISVGIIRGHCIDTCKVKNEHGNQQSKNWIVYKSNDDNDETKELLLDSEVATRNPQLPNTSIQQRIQQPKYPIGTVIQKEFHLNGQTTKTQWFQGRILGHLQIQNRLCNWVLYDDGDNEDLEDHEIDQLLLLERNGKKNKKHGNDKQAKRKHKENKNAKASKRNRSRRNIAVKKEEEGNQTVIKQEDESNPTAVVEPKQEEPRPDPSNSSAAQIVPSAAASSSSSSDDPVPLVSSSSLSSATADDAPPSSSSSSITADDAPSSAAQPDAAHSSSSSTIADNPAIAASSATTGASQSSVRRIQQDMDTVHCVKLEPDKQWSSNTISKYNATTSAWIEANTDPATKKGRYVFRKASHPFSIMKLLGGNGMDHINMSKKEDFPFNPKGHIWVAGNEAWNPYGPQYPGAEGLVDARVLKYVTPEGSPHVQGQQTEFHLFIECSADKLAKHWQGELAIGGRHYVGVYKIPEDAIEETVLFMNVPRSSQYRVAKHKLRCERKENGGKNPFTNDDVEKAKLIHAEDWEKMSTHDQDVEAYICCLIDDEWSWSLTNAEFVRYDEELYKALVDMTVDGQRDSAVAITNGKRKRVSIDAEELWRYQSTW